MYDYAVYSTFGILLAFCFGILLLFMALFQWEMHFKFQIRNLKINFLINQFFTIFSRVWIS